MLPALRPLRRLPLARLRRLLSSSSGEGGGGPPSAVASADAAVRAAKLREEAYKQVANLDWSSSADLWKALDLVKTLPPKRKEFGLDFHLVQLFFVCLPSLAVYLVAQYARREIKRMEAEAEEKRRKDEELEKEKQVEADSVKGDTDSKLSAVLVRLDTLEGVVNEIVDDKKKVETSSPGRVSDAEINASDGQVVPVKSKDANGATNSSPSSTKQNPTGNGDKGSTDPKG